MFRKVATAVSLTKDSVSRMKVHLKRIKWNPGGFESHVTESASRAYLGSRRDQILVEAARLFAARGFLGVGIDEIGAAVGISGPGIYRHFASKEEILVTLLVGINETLHEGGEGLAKHFRGIPLLDELIAFHLNFSLIYSDLIVLHKRELNNLEPASREEVRRLQRAYAAIWVGAILESCSEMDEQEAQLRTQACRGLLNATPHMNTSAIGSEARDLLVAMARAALYAQIYRPRTKGE
jgi:AcrR family transcriptional regulator